jgi:predicted nucleic acid-binding protein
MIYLDTSVGLAQLLAEDRVPPAALWEQPLVASRLIQYEIWTRLHARGLGASHGEAARDLLARVAFIELAPPVLERALAPFPSPVRTLDALHLASIEFLRAQRQDVTLATYDERMAAAARALHIPLYDLTESPAQNRGR